MTPWLCPCGCGREVKNNHYWSTDKCARRMNKKGVKMPIRYEAMRSKNRMKKKVRTL